VLALPGGLELLPNAFINDAVGSLIFLAMLCPPVAIAVAVLRYRLWDLDRLVSRTVTYSLVTGLLVVPYLLVVPAATRLAGDAGSLAVAGATLTVAAAFQPLRRRVQDRVDRRFNRRRYDAARTVERSPPACASRSTWMRSPPSCWPWSTGPCNRLRRRCGCVPADPARSRLGQLPNPHRRPGPWGTLERRVTPAAGGGSA